MASDEDMVLDEVCIVFCYGLLCRVEAVVLCCWLED